MTSANSKKSSKETRCYRAWTPEEIDQIRQGIIPKNHNSHAACYLKAKSLGFEFHVAKRSTPKNWSDDEMSMLKKGIIPPGKSWKACMAVASSLKMNFRKLFNDRPWSEQELATLKNGTLPPHRDQNTAYQIARKYGWNVISKLKFKEADMDSVELGQKYYNELIKNNSTVNDLAVKYNTSRQNVHRLIKLFKISYFDNHFVGKPVE